MGCIQSAPQALRPNGSYVALSQGDIQIRRTCRRWDRPCIPPEELIGKLVDRALAGTTDDSIVATNFEPAGTLNFA
jgi:hypothetical protein